MHKLKMHIGIKHMNFTIRPASKKHMWRVDILADAPYGVEQFILLDSASVLIRP
jgi:hypothetical protein